MNGKSVLVYTALFIYSLVLIAKGELISVKQIYYNNNYGEAVLLAVMGFCLAVTVFKHWLSNLLEWAKPPEDPTEENK